MAIDVFLVLNRDVQGVKLPAADECTDTAMNKEAGYVIQPGSIHFGIANGTNLGSASSGAGAGKAVFAELIVTRKLDSLSPSLLQTCGLGASFPEVKLYFRKPGATAPYLTYLLKTALLTAVTWSGAGEVAEEHLTFAYEALKIDYWTQDAKTGALSKVPVSGAWSQVSNSATY